MTFSPFSILPDIHSNKQGHYSSKLAFWVIIELLSLITEINSVIVIIALVGSVFAAYLLPGFIQRKIQEYKNGKMSGSGDEDIPTRE